jgi:hypothetical protein
MGRVEAIIVGLGLGIFALMVGLLLLYLSSQTWYIKWVQERIPSSEERLVKIERHMAIYLILFGAFWSIRGMIY